jgi:hypothetical protein
VTAVDPATGAVRVSLHGPLAAAFPHHDGHDLIAHTGAENGYAFAVSTLEPPHLRFDQKHGHDDEDERVGLAFGP